MAEAKKTAKSLTETGPAGAKRVAKKRTPKPVTDLPTAAAAYKKALAVHTKAYGALLDATEAEKTAADAKAEAKEVMDRHYRAMTEGRTYEELLKDEQTPGTDAQDAALEG